MARPVDILIKVRDAASDKLKKVKEHMEGLGRSTESTGKFFSDFNKRLFATIAIVATFERAFSKLFKAIDIGSEVGRLTDQFENLLGPSGDFFKLLDKATDHTIDRVEAMREAMALKSEGIINNAGDIADYFAEAGTAAIRMGKDSSFGIKEMSSFLRDASVEHLNNLGLVNKSSAAYQTYMAVLEKAGGGLGHVLSTQARLSLGTKLLNDTVANQLKGHRDLRDIVQGLSFSFQYLRNNIGQLLGKAFGPLLDKVGQAVKSFADYIDMIRRTDKDILPLIKSITLLAIGVGALLAVTAAWRLIMFSIGGAGGPMWKLIFLGGLLVSGFELLGFKIEDVKEGFKEFFEVFRGSWQLIHSFLSDPENFAKGIGKMDSALYDFLAKKGLLELAVKLGQVGSVIGTFLKGVVTGFIAVVKALHHALELLGVAFNKIFGKDSDDKLKGQISTWSVLSRNWLKIAGAIGAIVGVGVGFKALGRIPILGNLLQKIPGIGGFFGGGKGFGGAPKGTANDPIYTKNVGVLGGLGGDATVLLGGGGIIRTVIAAILPFIPVILAVLAGALAGYGIVKGLDKLTGGRYSSIVGKPGEWLASKMEGDIWAKGAAMVKRPMSPSQTTTIVPDKDAELNVEDFIKNTSAANDAELNKKLQAQMSSTFKDSGKEGTIFSDPIMTDLLVQMNNHLKKISNNTNEGPKTSTSR